jgi:hypothetical protein
LGIGQFLAAIQREASRETRGIDRVGDFGASSGAQRRACIGAECSIASSKITERERQRSDCQGDLVADQHRPCTLGFGLRRGTTS